jgi:Arm DNA-binding domain
VGQQHPVGQPPIDATISKRYQGNWVNRWVDWVTSSPLMHLHRFAGLGGVKVVTLAEAREEARKYRAMARNDGDPLAEKRRARRVAPTFRQAAETVHKARAKAWKNTKHSEQWINTLRA